MYKFVLAFFLCNFTYSITEARPPAENYVIHCSGCHKPNGSGSPSNLVPDIRNVIGHFTKVSKGREYLIQVADISQAPLRNDEIAALMNWVLREFSKQQLSKDFKPYTQEEVKELRENRPADLHANRRKLLASLQGKGIVLPDYVRP